MGIRAASTRRTQAASAISGQTVDIYSATGISVSGAKVLSSTNINLGIVTPGQSQSQSSTNITPWGSPGPAQLSSSFVVEYLIVGGGGGGGGNTGAGGGGGGYISASFYAIVGNYLTITVGAGGGGGVAGSYSYPSGGQIGGLGNQSSIQLNSASSSSGNYNYYPPVIALGGGGGTGWDVYNATSFKNGASGAGCATGATRGYAVNGQGYYGGLNAAGAITSQCSPGGGGAGDIGADSTGTGASSIAGAGGNGIQWPAGSGTYYAGGGGGGGGTSNRASNGTGINGGAGGLGGGGAGGNGTAGAPGAQNPGAAGSANKGGGGGGGNFTYASWGGAGGAGGSGIVIIRYPSSYPAAASSTGTLTTVGAYKYYTFTSSGTHTF